MGCEFGNETRLSLTQIRCNCKTILNLHHQIFTQMITKGEDLDLVQSRELKRVQLSEKIYQNTDNKQQQTANSFIDHRSDKIRIKNKTE